MANIKITGFPELITKADVDIIEIVDDVAGTPTSKKITITNLFKTINLTGGQIAFPATAVPSAGANTLDDYEEGTWTVGISFGGGTTGITYTSQEGRYTKIGNQIFFTSYMLLSSKGSSVGDAFLTGLPFVCKNSNGAYSCSSSRFGAISSADSPQSNIVINTSTIALREIADAGSDTTLTDANFTDTSYVMISGHYQI